MQEVREFLLENFRWAMDREKLLGPFKKDVKKIDHLVQITANLEEYPLKEYASYALTHLQKQGADLTKYRKVFIDTLFVTENQTVLRNLTYLLHHLEYTDYRESELLDLLISFLNNAKNKVALHVYSIYLLIQFVQQYPELKDEVREVILYNSMGKTPAYRIAIRNFEQALK